MPVMEMFGFVLVLVPGGLAVLIVAGAAAREAREQRLRQRRKTGKAGRADAVV